MTDERIRFGTAEVPKLARNLERSKKTKLRHNKLESKIPEIKESKVRMKYVEPLKAEGMTLGQATVGGKLKFERYRHKQSIKEYRKNTLKKNISSFKRRRRLKQGYRVVRSLFDNENIKEDELISDLKTETIRGIRSGNFTVRHNIRKLKRKYNVHAQIRRTNSEEWLLQEQRKKIHGKILRDEYRGQIKSASSQIQKRRLKKEMASAIRNSEGRFIRRNLHQIKVKITSTNRIIRTVKRVISTVLSVASLLIIFLSLLCIGFIIILGIVGGFAEYNEKAVTQNDYGVLSEATIYLRKLETDLQEYLNNKNQIEDELQSENGGEIYEFHYNLATTGFSNNTLMAYLSAKYGSFTLNQAKMEIEKVFADMYEFKVEIREEWRDIVDITETDPETGENPIVSELKKICYVTLVKSSLESVVEDRMNAEEKERYNNYKLSRGGQQVYSPVMKEDWTNKITSDYGERIHPITGERVFHNGIDIAIPTGTPLYSAVKGTVILAEYSESAGNYIKIQTDSGWTVIFMHMDSFDVERGQQVEKSDFVGYSGNSGRSTGPHLHLEVRDANGNTINPYFIVPQNCYEIEQKEE